MLDKSVAGTFDLVDFNWTELLAFDLEWLHPGNEEVEWHSLPHYTQFLNFHKYSDQQGFDTNVDAAKKLHL